METSQLGLKINFYSLSGTLISCLICLALFTNLAYALDCQYTEDVYKTETMDIFYENDIKLDYTLIELTEFKQTTANYAFQDSNSQFKIINNHPTKRIDLEVLFTKNGNLEIENVSLYPLGYAIVSRSLHGANVFIDFNSIRYNFLSEEFRVESEEVETLVNTTCKLCNGKTCLNDGMSCTIAQDCGSGYCIEGHCSNSESCFNNDCKCASDEIQCNDNKCVKKGVIPLDVKPKCNMDEECTSGYIDKESGLCAKSPNQMEEEEYERLKEERKANETMQKEENQRILAELEQNEREGALMIYSLIIIILIVIFGIIVYMHLKNKTKNLDIKQEEEKRKTIEKQEEEKRKTFEKQEEEKRKTLEKEIEHIGADIKHIKITRASIKEDIESGKKKIANLKTQIKKSEAEAKKEVENQIRKEKKAQAERIDSLKETEQELTKKEQELKDREEKFKRNNKDFLINEAIDKYQQRYHKKLYLDREGYLRFKDSEKLLHVYIYKENVQINKEGYVIHHIDANKVNDEIWNLIQIPENDHKKFKHARVIFGDWNSGIEQLKDQLKLEDKDFHKYIREHMNINHTSLN